VSSPCRRRRSTSSPRTPPGRSQPPSERPYQRRK
jgi:hypothetical protein